MAARHAATFYQNGFVDQAGVWHGRYFQVVLRFDLRKFVYLNNTGSFRYTPLEIFLKLPTWELEKIAMVH